MTKLATGIISSIDSTTHVYTKISSPLTLLITTLENPGSDGAFASF